MARNMDQVLADLEAEVQRDTTVSEGLVAMITKLQDELKNATANNPQISARVDAIFEGFKANTDKLAAALTANTPSEPPAGGGTGGTVPSTGGAGPNE